MTHMSAILPAQSIQNSAMVLHPPSVCTCVVYMTHWWTRAWDGAPQETKHLMSWVCTRTLGPLAGTGLSADRIGDTFSQLCTDVLYAPRQPCDTVAALPLRRLQCWDHILDWRLPGSATQQDIWAPSPSSSPCPRCVVIGWQSRTYFPLCSPSPVGGRTNMTNTRYYAHHEFSSLMTMILIQMMQCTMPLSMSIDILEILKSKNSFLAHFWTVQISGWMFVFT